ncbi:putative homogentisate phytyltransferase [Helianthus annuus]|nr:putative homogentisate phytyltransferase [Helianthus annuus]
MLPMNPIRMRELLSNNSMENLLELHWMLFNRYSRAYTLKGSALSIVSICLLSVQSLTDLTPSFCLGVLQAVIGGCLANLYVAGLNQLSDVKTGVLITSLYAILGFCLGWIVKSWPLKLSLFFWFTIGSTYSVHLPLLRWKRFLVVVTMCASLFQGVILPMLFYLHAQTNIHGRPLLLSKHAIFVFGIMSIYSAVISIFKDMMSQDIPDVEGDKMNGIYSFASILGPKRVFWICIWLLEMVYRHTGQLY